MIEIIETIEAIVYWLFLQFLNKSFANHSSTKVFNTISTSLFNAWQTEMSKLFYFKANWKINNINKKLKGGNHAIDKRESWEFSFFSLSTKESKKTFYNKFGKKSFIYLSSIV